MWPLATVESDYRRFSRSRRRLAGIVTAAMLRTDDSSWQQARVSKWSKVSNVDGDTDNCTSSLKTLSCTRRVQLTADSMRVMCQLCGNVVITGACRVDGIKKSKGERGGNVSKQELLLRTR